MALQVERKEEKYSVCRKVGDGRLSYLTRLASSLPAVSSSFHLHTTRIIKGELFRVSILIFYGSFIASAYCLLERHGRPLNIGSNPTCNHPTNQP